MKLGRLKEKTQPEHGRVTESREPSKFLELPKGARDGDKNEAEHGKYRRPHSPMSVDESMPEPYKEFRASAAKRGKLIPKPDGQDEYDVDKMCDHHEDDGDDY